MSKKKEFNGYSFGEKETRKRIKYIVVYNGDLDLNGVYSFSSLKDLKAYLKDTRKTLEAVFKVKDVSDFYLFR